MWIPAILLSLCSLLLLSVAQSAPTTFGTLDGLPPVIEDTTKAENCTVVYLVTDLATNDMIAVRMRITPDPNAEPKNNLMPCPPEIPPRVAVRALDSCVARAADPKDCVFADMGRDFEKRPTVNNTSEAASRCTSDKSTHIGVACWQAGELQVCGAGCGANSEAAITAAVGRCETKHQQQCPITGSLPVLAPR